MIHFKPYNEPFEFIFLNKPLGKSISLKPGETLKVEVVDVLPNGSIIARIKDQHVAIKTEIPLQKDTTLLLRVMDSANVDKKLKLHLIEQFKSKESINLIDLLQKFDLSNIDNLFKISNTNQNKEIILKFLIENGLFEELKSITKDIKNLFSKLNSSDNFFKSIKDLDYESFKEIIKNSGIFYENRLKRQDFESIKKDLKYTLFDLSQKIEDKNIKHEIKNILDKIESFQLFTHLTNSFYTFLPLIWDSLNGGDIAIKKAKDKEQYLCKISLDFEDLGVVEASIFLHQKDLKIDFFIEDQKLKDEIKSGILDLKSSLQEDGFKNIFISFLSQKYELKKFSSFKSIVDIKV